VHQPLKRRTPIAVWQLDFDNTVKAVDALRRGTVGCSSFSEMICENVFVEIVRLGAIRIIVETHGNTVDSRVQKTMHMKFNF